MEHIISEFVDDEVVSLSADYQRFAEFLNAIEFQINEENSRRRTVVSEDFGAQRNNPGVPARDKVLNVRRRGDCFSSGLQGFAIPCGVLIIREFGGIGAVAADGVSIAAKKDDGGNVVTGFDIRGQSFFQDTARIGIGVEGFRGKKRPGILVVDNRAGDSFHTGDVAVDLFHKLSEQQAIVFQSGVSYRTDGEARGNYLHGENGAEENQCENEVEPGFQCSETAQQMRHQRSISLRYSVVVNPVTFLKMLEK